MNKKDILKMETTAYYSGFNGLEIKGIEYGIDDHVLCVSGAWNGKPLKKPIREHNHKLYLSLQYEKDGNCYGKHPSTDGLNYCKADLLKIINNLSCDKFIDVEFVEHV